MPIYTYFCERCEARFEAVASIQKKENGWKPNCPRCGSSHTRQTYDSLGFINLSSQSGDRGKGGCCAQDYTSYEKNSGGIKLAQGFVDLATGLLLAAGTIVGAQIGATIIQRFKPTTLKLIFGLYFLYVAVKFITAFFGIRIW